VPSECPQRAAWLEGLRARLPALLQTHPLLEQLEVRVSGGGREPSAAYTGALAGAEEALGSGQREVRGASCGEVLDALAFIAALALQRAAAERAPPSHVAAAPPPQPAPFMADGGAPAARDRSSLAGAQAFALLRRGISGEAALAWGAGVQLGWDTPGWQPWLLLGAYAGSDGARLPSGARASVRHWSSHVVACPWRWPRQGALAVRPCADLELGVVSATGRGVTQPESQRAPWLSAGAQLRAELVLWRRVELGAWLGGELPLWHSRFYFRPDVTVFETAAFGLRGGSFVGLLF
jgi:hypothetical protein